MPFSASRFVITAHTKKAFEEYLNSSAFEAYRAGQVIDWIYKKCIFDFSEFKNLPGELIDFLSEKCEILSGSVVKREISDKDKTTKFLIRLPDSQFIESVLLYSDDSRITACLSTQVGCAACCIFCASGASGFKRNLTVSEIVSQYLLMRRDAFGAGNDISNIVFMGIGEPLLNYDNVISAIEILTDPELSGIAARRITISTVGITNAIDKLAEYKKQINLSISLHSAINEKRNFLVPVNKKYNINALMSSVKRYIAKTNRVVTFEYALIKGLNDTAEDVLSLSRILKGKFFKVNIIPLNPVSGVKLKAPSEDEVIAFEKLLASNKVKVTRRRRKGFDINLGCGQLKAKFISGNGTI